MEISVKTTVSMNRKIIALKMVRICVHVIVINTSIVGSGIAVRLISYSISYISSLSAIKSVLR